MNKNILVAGLVGLLILVPSYMFYGKGEAIPEPLYETPRTELRIHVELFDTLDQLNEYINVKHPQSVEALREGLAVWYAQDEEVNVCQILVVKDRFVRSAEPILGHEMLHCIYGSFHK